MKRTRINIYSLKKIAEKNAEAPIRIKLAYRAHGIPIETVEVVHRNDGSRHTIRRVKCINGICEECGAFAYLLDPHEKHSRGKGGKLSPENTKMVCRKCHQSSKLDKRQVRLEWLKPDSPTHTTPPCLEIENKHKYERIKT